MLELEYPNNAGDITHLNFQEVFDEEANDILITSLIKYELNIMFIMWSYI